jgi:hypothetical protein
MHCRTHTRRTGAALVAALVAVLALAAVAAASFTVYRNGFANHHSASELSHAEGDHCEKAWRDRAKAIRVVVKRGQESCGYRPPVEADADLPDQTFEAKMKILRNTPKSTRENAFIGLAVRSGGGNGYEFRVFPKGKVFELRRHPAGGGSDFPATGTNADIRGLDDSNALRLKVSGAVVKAYVNGTKVAEATDTNPAEVGGRKLEVIVGNTKDTKKDVFGVFDDLRVSVPG